MKPTSRLTTNCCALAFLLATAPTIVSAQDDALAEAAERENLEKVDGAWSETWVNPDIDFSHYNKLALGSAVFDYRDVGPARSYRPSLSRRSSSQTVFGISEKDRAEFEAIVGEAFDKEIAKGHHYAVTDTIDDQTILVRGAVVDIVSKVPPRQVGASDIYLSSVGEATLALEFLDAATGDVLAVVADRGVISSSGGTISEFAPQPANPGSIRMAVRLWASNAGKTLRQALDEALGQP